MNRPQYALGASACSTAVFLAIAINTIPAYGAIGASFAHIGFGAVNAIMLDVAMWRSLRRASASQVAPEAS